MAFLEKFFGIKPLPFSFENAAYLAPWYFNETEPKLNKNNEVLKWNFIHEVEKKYVGLMFLEDDKGNCYGAVNTYSYILPSFDSKTFLVWKRAAKKEEAGQSIEIFNYSVDDLRIIDRSEVLQKNNEYLRPFYFNADPVSSIRCVIDPSKQKMVFEFPDEFIKFREFVVVTELEDLYSRSDESKQWHNTTLLVFKPGEDSVYNYPQDWFNKSNADFGHQWITRAVRNPDTNKIHVQGIRINDFILDKTNKETIQ